MAFYEDEEEVWRCPKHPSKRRKSGICPTCLRERLNALCPDCAGLRPCSCCPSGTASSSSSTSSSFSFFSFSGSVRESAGGSIGRMSNLIDSEPSFRRSRSVGIPSFLSRFAASRNAASGDSIPPLPTQRNNKSSFWSVFRKSKRSGESREEEEDAKKTEIESEDNYARKTVVVVEEEEEADYSLEFMMRRSRSVSVPVVSGAGRLRSSWRKSRGWHFPSPFKALRQSKTSKVVQERSPLHRG